MLTSLSPTLCSSKSTLNGLSVTPFTSQRPHAKRSLARQQLVAQAKLGGSGDQEQKNKGFITADEEPDEFWQSKSEAKGGLAPLKDPVAIFGIIGILLPFVILGIAIGTGYVDVAPKASLGAHKY